MRQECLAQHFKRMKQIAKPDQLDFPKLIVLLLFFDFFSKFIGYQYIFYISPFSDFVDAKIAASVGDVIFLLLISNIFQAELRGYLIPPKIVESVYYGVSLQIIFLGIMVPVGFLSLKINQDYFYNYWWEYKDIPVFYYSSYLFSSLFELENFLFFICIVLIAPIVEEVVYRLAFYKIFRRRYSPVISMIMVAIIFDVVHPTYFFLAFLASLSLSFLIFRTGSVWSAVISHGTYNVLSFVDSHYLGIGSFKPINSVGSIDGWVIQFVFLPLSVVIIYLFFRNNKNELEKLFSRSAVKNELP